MASQVVDARDSTHFSLKSGWQCKSRLEQVDFNSVSGAAE